MRKLSDDECPLFLRLCAGPSEKVLSLVLKENETGEVNVSCRLAPSINSHDNLVNICKKKRANICTDFNVSPPQWDAFSFPELCNFLRILQREEEEHVRQIVKRYALARDMMKQAMARITTPGWVGAMKKNILPLWIVSLISNVKGKERAQTMTLFWIKVVYEAGILLLHLMSKGLGPANFVQAEPLLWTEWGTESIMLDLIGCSSFLKNYAAWLDYL